MKAFLRKIICFALAALTVIFCFGCADNNNTLVTPEPAASPSDFDGKLKIYCFSVGCADSFLIYTDNFAVLIDTGEEDRASLITDYVKKHCEKKLDALIITHFDQDHVGGAVRVLKKCEIGQIIRPVYAKDSIEYDNYTEARNFYGLSENILSEDFEFVLDGVTFTVYPPEESDYSEDASNNSSLIVSVKYGSKKFLFMGDAEKERTKEFLNAHPEKYDFIKMPCHGRWFKALSSLILTTAPEYAVITSSVNEPESETTSELLDYHKVKTFLTKEGPVWVKCDGENISVEYVSEQ